MTDVVGRRPEPDPAAGHVTAVLVSHDGAGWLPRTLSALAGQTRRPDVTVAVDTGSTDDSPRMLTEALGGADVLAAPVGTPYAAAVAHGLGSRPPPADGWIWLLHDDAAPAADALAALLAEASTAPDIGIVGAKSRAWPSGAQLLEVGVTISGTGRRISGLEPGEPDQGQHDRPRDVLAVGTAGMLVRADVWRGLGGLDARLGLAADLDLGWRAARAGHRVRVAPAAVVFHAEAAARGRRTPGALTGSPRQARRQAALLVLLANCGRTVLAVQLVRLLVGSLLRAVGLLLVRAPRDGWDELRAVCWVYARPVVLWQLRRDRRRTATRRPGQVRHLLPTVWAPYRARAAEVLELLAAGSRSGTPAAADSSGAADTGPVDMGVEALPPQPGRLARLTARPLATASLALLGLTVLALRGRFTGGELQGGALLPAPGGSRAWWSDYLASSHPAGVGSTAPAPPYELVLAGLGTVTLGDAGLLVSVLLVMAVPVAAMSAHLLLRRLGVRVVPRMWACLAYASLPLLTGALAQGRLGTVLATAWLPLVATTVLDLGLATPADEEGQLLWSRRLRAGLALAVLVGLVPVAYLLALVLTAGLLAVALAPGRAQRPVSATVSGLVVLAVPWLLAPWWLLDRLHEPASWWWEAGLPDAGVGVLAPDALDLALGRPGGPGVAAVVGWLGTGVVLAALLALVRTDARSTVGPAWCVASTGLVFAAVGAGRTVELAGRPAPVWTGFCLVVWWGGLLVAAAAAAGDLRSQLTGRSFGWRQPTAALVVVAAAVGPPAALVVQVAAGVGGPLRRAEPVPVPSYLADAAQADPAAGTLLVDGTARGGLGLTIVRDDGWRLGDEPYADAAGSPAITAALRDLLVAPDRGSVRTLAAQGLGYLYAPAPVDPDLVAALDTAPGLALSGAPTGDRAWQLDAVVGAPVDGSGDAAVRPGPVRRWWVAAQLAGLVVVAVLAAPTRRRRS